MSTDRKIVLLTGGNGYMGKVLRDTLRQKGFVVKTLGRSGDSDYRVDLAKEVPLFNESFDFVVHNAGKAHMVPRSKEQADDFFRVNVDGTSNLLEGLSRALPKSIVFISSISVYGLASGTAVTESTPLQATDPYGKSKIEAEKIISEWAQSNGVTFACLRLPLVAGKNPPGNLGAMISGIKRGRYFQIEKSIARKSIVMADDVAAILPLAASRGGIFNLTDAHHPSFSELEEVVTKQLQKPMPRNIPMTAAKLLGLAGDVIDYIFPGRAPITSAKVNKIASTLTFDDTKARKELAWKPNRVIDVFKIS